jgi:hypothetical protein
MKQKFDHETYVAFGVVVHHKRLPAGDSYVVHVPEDIQMRKLGNFTLYTKGRVTAKDADGKPGLYERTPGYTTLFDRLVPKGVFTHTIQEDAEWWCINQFINERRGIRVPTLEVFNLPAGESKTLPVGTRLLLCDGAFTAKDRTFCSAQSLEVKTEAVTATATQNCYGFIFGK